METTTLEMWLKAAFEAAFPGNDFSNVVALPATDSKFGDFQCNNALASAKVLHMPPRAIAEAVFAKLTETKPDFISKVELAGPGFLNITVSEDWLASRLSVLDKDCKTGIPQVGESKTVVIDYSSPNAAKQMHIGHIRSTVIGNAIDRLYRSIGYIAYQNRAAFQPGTAAYEYVWDIIRYVYGDQYDAEYKGKTS